MVLPQDLILQREGMLLIDEVSEVDGKHAVAKVYHQQPGLFSDASGAVPAWVGIEYMAQTASLMHGYVRRQQGKEPGIAFLLGTRKYLSHCDRFTAGQTVLVKAAVQMFDEQAGLCMIDCQIVSEQGDLLAQASLKAIQPEDHNEFLKGLQLI